PLRLNRVGFSPCISVSPCLRGYLFHCPAPIYGLQSGKYSSLPAASFVKDLPQALIRCGVKFPKRPANQIRAEQPADADLCQKHLSSVWRQRSFAATFVENLR